MRAAGVARAFGLSALACACSSTRAEIAVHDANRVGVTERTQPPVPLMAPDGFQGRVPVRGVVASAALVRAGGQIDVEWSDGTRLPLVDQRGSFPAVREARGLALQGGYLLVPYDVAARRVYPMGQGRDVLVPLVLWTPLDNLERAQRVSGLPRWPGVVMTITGTAFTALGASFLAASTAEHKTENRNIDRGIGVGFLAAGVPTLGVGLYFLLDRWEIEPLFPDAPMSDE